MVSNLTLALFKCVHLPYLRHLSLMTKIYGLLQLIIKALLHNCAFSIDSYSPINKFYSFIIFSVLINLLSLLKHYLELYITDTALKISKSLYCFTTSISHGVENYFPRLWGTGISVASFRFWGMLNLFFMQ